jgi:Phage integrase family
VPERAADALPGAPEEPAAFQLAAGHRWQGAGLVFCTSVGTALDAANVRRSFRRVAAAAGLDAQAWTPRELRHSFVSLLSSTGMSIEDISHLVGHASSRVTELVYRKELRPAAASNAPGHPFLRVPRVDRATIAAAGHRRRPPGSFATRSATDPNPPPGTVGAG